jgi:hypothetical protein
LGDVRSAIKLDDVELRMSFMRIEEAAHSRRDRIAAMPRDANPIRAAKRRLIVQPFAVAFIGPPDCLDRIAEKRIRPQDIAL